MAAESSFKLLSQGAEGRVFAASLLSQPAIMKERLSKGYRVRALDLKLNRQRLLQEARCMVKCRKAGVPTPTILLVDQARNRLYMEMIQGQTVKELLKASLSLTGGKLIFVAARFNTPKEYLQYL